jgi:hypothetical protein
MVLVMSAQKINHQFNNIPMSDALRFLSTSSNNYTINFIYDELEDFHVTTNIQNQTLPDAIHQMIGFYPISMKVSAGEVDQEGKKLPNAVYVECMQKDKQKIIGHVVDLSGAPLDFANIALLNVKDSSFINGGVSNESGYFAIPCSAEKVLMKVTYVGYHTLFKVANVGRVGSVRLTPDAHLIKGVMVKGLRKVEHGDHAVYTFNDEQLKNSRQSQEIMATLPDLRIDPLSGKLATLSGKSIKILINGVEASDNDLKTLPADKIKNVEYYNIPPARYNDVQTLINIKTAPLDAGYAAGFDVDQAVKRGFDDTNVYYRYNKGNHQFSFDYSLHYRNHGNCKSHDEYTFKNNNDVSTYYYHEIYHFGYADQNFNLKYLYSKSDSTIFQVKFTPNIYYRFWRGNNTVTAENNPNWSNGSAWQDQKTHSLGPSLDFYFDKKLVHRQELTLDILGTYYHNRQENINNQKDDTGKELLDDDMKQRNSKYSVITELVYTHGWRNVSLGVGYKGTLAKSFYHISNVLSDYKEYLYHSANDNHYVYTQIDGQLKKLNYRLSVGGTYITTHNDEDTYHKLLFTPQMVLSYPFKNCSFQLEVISEPDIPTISQLSNNSSVAIPGLVRRGNPALKAGNDNTAKFTFSYTNSYIILTNSYAAEYSADPICSTYTWTTLNGEKTILETYQNFKNNKCYMADADLQVKPFGNEILTLDIYGKAARDSYNSNIYGKRSHTYFPLSWSVSFRKGNWGGFYQGMIVTKSFDGSYLNSEENDEHIGAFYQHKQLHVGINCFFFLTKPHYSTDLIENDVLAYHHYNELGEQSSMICLNISYNLFSGKQKHVEKKINNYDGDKGL